MAALKPHSLVDHNARFWQEAREKFDADVRKVSSEQDKLGLLISIQSFSFHFIKEAARTTPAEPEVVEEGLAALWHMFLETAKVFEKDDAIEDKLVSIQDRLVSLLLWTKEFDSVYRSLHHTEKTTSGWESYRFADNLQASWEQLLTTGTVSQQCNLAAFSAKALAVGICGDLLGLTALWYLREAFETDDEAKALALLHAAVVWIDHCRHKLLAFTAKNQSYEVPFKAHLLAPGALAQRANIDQHGFSLNRWLFWRRRLQELSRNADPEVAQEAKRGFMCMINCGRDLDYEVPGEAIFAERLQAAMWEALAKSGKESVSGDEVDINVDWVD